MGVIATENLAKTLQIFLPDGEPRGVRIADITTRIVQVVVVPRTKLAEPGKRPEPKSVGVYFLFGDSDERARPTVYIGEAEDCYDRLKQHNANKDFWKTGVAVVSKTGSFTKAHAKYLEWYCLKKCREIGRYEIANQALPLQPSVPEPMVADLMDAFETTDVLLSALGYPIFERTRAASHAEVVFHCRARNSDAKGRPAEDGFVVFAGSKANPTTTDGAPSWIAGFRRELIEGGVLRDEDGTLMFPQDYMFKSPSTAASIVSGRSMNGWTEWTDSNGQTLDEVQRTQEEP